MVNLSSTVFLFGVLHLTSAVPHGGRQTSTAHVSSSTVFIDSAAVSEMADTEHATSSEVKVAESTLGFRSRRKGNTSLYPPISSSTVVASPSATSLPHPFYKIFGTTEPAQRHGPVQEPHSTMTLGVRSTDSSTPEDLTPLSMPLPDIVQPCNKTASPTASSTSTSSPDDLIPLLMPLPEIVQPANETATTTTSSKSTSTPEDLTPLLMPLPPNMEPSNSTTTLAARLIETSASEDLTSLLMPLPEIVQPADEAATLTTSSSSTNTPEDLTPLLMPLPPIMEPSDKTAPSTTSSTSTSTPGDLTPTWTHPPWTPRPNILQRRGFGDWLKEEVESLTEKTPEELRKAIENWGEDGLRAAVAEK
ncbi:hypothetical protein BDV97DRAFT_373755 [Delphinella strobiligena]|nr:hypothetical protein BDV97DRAFT_373755 [Delphinella strobiligena]